MNCAQCKDQLVAYLEDTLDTAQQDGVESHLDACPACRGELEQTRRLHDRLVHRGQSAAASLPDLHWRVGIASKQTAENRRKRMKQVARIAVAAAVLIGAFLVVPPFFSGDNGFAALAQAAEQMQRAKTVTWTVEFYQRITSKDKSTQWVETGKTKHMWKAPGLKRQETFDAEGRVRCIQIDNHLKGSRLSIFPQERKAHLSYRGAPLDATHLYCSDFVTRMSRWLTKTEDGWIMGEPKKLGTKKIKGRKAIGYRVSRETFVYNRGADPKPDRWTADLWIDAETKQLVRTHNPGLDIYDPTTDPLRQSPPGDGTSSLEALGNQMRDIEFDVELDDSLFSLDPPEGYEVTTVGTPIPPEKDMVEWLGIRAECNGGVFLDDPGQLLPEAVMNRILEKWSRQEKLTPAEQKVFENSGSADPYFPVKRFIVLVAGDTWHYSGAGVRLGDKDAAVCWYKPKDSKTYRIVYGDLSVKDIAPEDLPKTR